MSKKNELSRLSAQLGKQTSSGIRSSPVRALVGDTPLQADTSVRPSRNDGTRSIPGSSYGPGTSGLRFGSPSQRVTHLAAASGSWDRLLMRGASGGISSLLHGGIGGGSIFSVATGLGGLISGLIGLFGGGKKTPPPLQLFHLPDSRNEAISISSSRTVEQGPVYTTSTTGSQSAGGVLAQTQEAYDVAHAVKLALLNSHSLADTISEL